jgi:two-component system nitrate/nitrite sensor histidine kinase NarX
MNQLQNSLLLRIGGMIVAITMLALVSMSTSWMIAETTQGNGQAINLAGSLRMQSWRMASLYQQQITANLSSEALQQAIQNFEEDLTAPAILSVLPIDASNPLRRVYQQVVSDWQNTIKPALLTATEYEQRIVLGHIPPFVNQINNLVKQIEEATEAKIFVLRVILGVAIIGTLLIVILSIYLINNILVKPLTTLLGLTERIRQGKLAVRTDFVGDDEIGQLGRAFNRMAEDLAKLYQDLETRVEQKTAELTRSNRSLELLYRSITRLHGTSPSPEVFQSVLKDAEAVLGLDNGLICLKTDHDLQGKVIASTQAQLTSPFCQQASHCQDCNSSPSISSKHLSAGQTILRLPLADAEKRYGVLAVNLPVDQDTAQWQIPLLEALSRHIGITLASEQRSEQHRRVSLLEERAVIARELHDSLAQSLAYMKIQVSRLRTALKHPEKAAEVNEALEELREGLNSSYQQLRELLSTFRLRMEEADLGRALQQTVNEFAERGQLPIHLELALGGINLSPNEEIHLLQIVREALSNILKHAKAEQAWVSLQAQVNGKIRLQIEDNGIGIQKTAAMHHYGMAIMEERARALHGTLEYLLRATGGTCVRLDFTPNNTSSFAQDLRITHAA